MPSYKNLEIVSDFDKYVKDKKTSARAYYRYFLSRLLRMFQYKNLPDTIPHEILDRYLFENGIACITKGDDDKLYVFFGNAGGEYDIYYRPTKFIVSNPHLGKDGFTKEVVVFEGNGVGQPTGVLMRNDTDWLGLHPMIARYSYLMAENILTLRTADVMLRIIALITAKTDKERLSAIEYLKSIEKGELGVIGESSFHEGVELQSPPSNNGSYLTQFIEYQQYLKGSFYNELGLSSNYNMKREAIGKGESTLDEDALLPLCDNMLKCRREDLAKVNKMFGTDIEVEFSSSWLENRIETLAAIKELVGQPTGGFGFTNPSSSPVGQPMESPEADVGGEVGSSCSEVDESCAGDGSARSENEASCNENDGSCNEDDSPINDLSQDKEITELLEDLKENLENDEAPLQMQTQTQLVNQPDMKGDKENGDSGVEKSTED